VSAAEATPIDRIVADNQPARRQLELAAAILSGDSAAAPRDEDAALRELERAVVLEDALPYTEPPAWYFPCGSRSARALLAAGRADAAAAVYREDLRRNPENGWSLFGLAKSLRARGEPRARRRRIGASGARGRART
jgi:tetratricopeptide (TPR) repeat protein